MTTSGLVGERVVARTLGTTVKNGDKLLTRAKKTAPLVFCLKVEQVCDKRASIVFMLPSIRVGQLNLRRLTPAIVAVLVATVSSLSISLAADALADGGTCTNGALVSGASLSVDGVLQDPASGEYTVTVCRWPTGMTQVYTYYISTRSSGSTATELGEAAVGKTFTASFTMADGDQPISAEVYGDVSDYTVSGQNVVVTAKPVSMTQINGPPNAGTTCELPATPVGVCATSVAKLSGGVRYVAESGTARPGDALIGMYIGASANGYQVDLQGCPGISYSNPAATSADAPPSSSDPNGASVPVLSVQMNGPHFEQDGTTLNSGSLEAFMPNALLATCVGGDAAAAKAGLSVTRTESGSTTTVSAGAFTATAESDGLRIIVPRVGFSSPTYKMSFKKAAKPSKPVVQWISKKSSKTITATATSVTGVTYAISAKTAKKVKSGICRPNAKTKKNVCTITLARGSWTVSVTPKRRGVTGTANSKRFVF